MSLIVVVVAMILIFVAQKVYRLSLLIKSISLVFYLGALGILLQRNLEPYHDFRFLYCNLAFCPLGNAVCHWCSCFHDRSLPKGARFLQPAIELLVGIPSVVYGFIGLQVVVPFTRSLFGGTGFGILSGVFVPFVMILPTVTFMTTDSLRAVPRHYREASMAMGATRWQTIWHVTLKAARSGIFTAVVFGMARAFGEALAIQMVVGNSAVVPTSLTTPASTLTSILTMGIGNTVMGTVNNNVLWSLALVLLLMSLAFNSVIKLITKKERGKKNYAR